MALLAIEELVVRFGGVTALDGPSLHVEPGTICGLIGPNGAGKTTLFNCVSRLYTPESGSIDFDGTDLLAREPHEISALGIARTFQNLGLFRSLTVRENVMLGAYSRARPSFLGSSLRLGATTASERELEAAADEVLERLRLAEVADHPATGLPYGTLKRLELARAVFQRPRLLMLDEPASGLNHSEVERARRADPSAALGLRPDAAARRAQHGHGHGDLRPGRGPQPRPQDRRGRAATGPGAPARDRGLPGGAGMSLLEVEGLRASYGPVLVLEGIDFTIEQGRRVALLGPNGAGKTTVLRALSGMVKTSGKVDFDGRSLIGSPTATIARRGVAHVPEGRGTFGELTVEENLRLGAYIRDDGAAAREDLGRCYGWFPRLEERKRQQAGSLSGGEQQMLALARALMLRPRLLMLDEPSLGLAPILTSELFRVLGQICDEHGMTVLLVEQNANLALDFADHAHVLESGRIALSGEADRIKGDDEVRRSYLGY